MKCIQKTRCLKNRIISLLLVLLMIATMDGTTMLLSTIEVSAADFEADPDEVNLGGNGTETDPYIISTSDDLWKVTQAASKASLKGYYKLIADIKLDGEWTPIGSGINSFNGTFDGNEHVITGILINDENSNEHGFFGCIADATVKDLTIVGSVCGKDEVGLLAGSDSGSSEITNCHVTGTVLGKGNNVGGLIGGNGTYNDNNSIMLDCVSECNVSGDFLVGGLVGSNSGEISNCYATGNVSGYRNTGGLVGYSFGLIKDSYAKGDVIINENAPNRGDDSTSIGGLVGGSQGEVVNCHATGDVIGKKEVGGLIGCLAATTMTNCYAKGDVAGEEEVGGLIGTINTATIANGCAMGNVSGNKEVGGLVGYDYHSSITGSCAMGEVSGDYYIGGLVGRWGIISYVDSVIENCFAIGDVTGNDHGIGGLIGYYSDSTASGKVTNCYAIGNVSGEKAVRGLIGSNDRKIITNCYYNKANSESGDSSKYGLAKTLIELKNQDTYEEWDFDKTWEIDGNINSGYPYLKWTVSILGGESDDKQYSNLKDYAKSHTYLNDSTQTYTGYIYREDGNMLYSCKGNVPVKPMSYDIDDYDNDGEDELLIVDLDSNYKLILKMYEIINGKVTQTATKEFYEFPEENSECCAGLNREQTAFNCFAYEYNGKKTIGVEDYAFGRVTGDVTIIYVSAVQYDGKEFNHIKDYWVSGSDFEGYDYSTDAVNELNKMGIRVSKEKLDFLFGEKIYEDSDDYYNDIKDFIEKDERKISGDIDYKKIIASQKTIPKSNDFVEPGNKKVDYSNISFSKSGDSGDGEMESEYDFSSDLDRWLISKETSNFIRYLATDSNFPNTLAVAAKDDSFTEHVVSTMSNMYYRGLDGWKEIFLGTTSKEEAEKVLVALLDTYDDDIKELSQAKTAKKYAKAYVDTLKWGNWAYATEYGLNSAEINELSKMCTKDKIADFFVDGKDNSGKYISLSAYLQVRGGYDANSDVVKCVEEFGKSQQLANSLNDCLKTLGDGLKILSMTQDTIGYLYDLESLISADEMYSEMLLYVKNNCSYKPITDAASELYNVIHGGYLYQLNYVATSLKNELDEKVVDTIISAVVKKIPWGELIKESYEFAVDVSNILFNIDSTEEQVINMRCVAYIGSTLKSWLIENWTNYLNGAVIDKPDYAKKTVYAYYMLLKTRIAGEESYQKMLELNHTSWLSSYKWSVEIMAYLKSNEEWIKQEGIIDNIITHGIACPVNVQLYNSAGILIKTIKDGTEEEGYINDVYYVSCYDSLNDDYLKIIRIPEDSGYSIKCVGTDLGIVGISSSVISDDGKVLLKETTNIPIQTGYEINILNADSDSPLCKLIGDNKTETQYSFYDKNEYVSVQSLKSAEESLVVGINEKKRIDVEAVPQNATSQDLNWMVDNDDIIMVNSDGVITGIKEGNATVTVSAADNDSISKNIAIEVKKDVNKTTTEVQSVKQTEELPENNGLEIIGNIDNNSNKNNTDSTIVQIPDNNTSNKDTSYNVKSVKDTETVKVDQAQTSIPKVNTKITVNNSIYRVTSSSENGGTVEYVKPTTKKLTKAAIPSALIINGKIYKVTSIAAKAFKNNKKLKQIDIGKNIKKIGKQAFYNCKKLNKLVIRSKKLTNKNVGSNTFKGVNKNVRVFVPESKINSYMKLLKKKGLKKNW